MGLDNKTNRSTTYRQLGQADLIDEGLDVLVQVHAQEARLCLGQKDALVGQVLRAVCAALLSGVFYLAIVIHSRILHNINAD